jgi:hypothetical protein
VFTFDRHGAPDPPAPSSAVAVALFKTLFTRFLIGALTRAT